ncbi:MAG: hypothetical protein AB8H79_10020 [Myxococcota bacterium]
MKERGLSVREPLLLGGLFTGLEVLVLLVLPLWLLVFCIVHALHVANAMRIMNETALEGDALPIWMVMITPSMVLLSAGTALVVSVPVVVTVGIGTVVWRLFANLLERRSQRSAYKRYRGMAENDEMAPNAWGMDGEE